MEINGNNNNQKSESSSLLRWVMRCLGLVLIALSVIAATGKTFLGAFLAYSISFAFGIYFPLILIIMIAIGVTLLIRARLFSASRNLFLVFGMILLAVSLLAFASYPAFSENPINILELNSTYLSRMQAFSSHPFVQIDDYSMLSALGGGYVGMFLVTLLGGVWGNIGNAILFSLMLLAAMFFVSYKPVQAIFQSYRKAKESKIQYDSKYRKAKGNTDFLNRNTEVSAAETTEIEKPSASNTGNYSPFSSFKPYDPNQENHAEPEENNVILPERATPVNANFGNEQLRQNAADVNVQDSPFTSYRAPEAQQPVTPAPQPVVQQQPVYQQQTAPVQQPAVQQPVYQQPTAPVQQQQPVYQQPSPVQQQVQQTPVYQPPVQPTPAPVQQQPVYQQPAAPVQQPVYQQPVSPAVPQTPVYQQPAVPVQQQQPVYQQPSPVQQPVQPAPVVPQPVQQPPVYPAPSQQPAAMTSKPIYFSLEEEPQPEEEEDEEEILAPVQPPVPEVHEPTQEEIEADLEKKYFENKRKKLSEQIMEKQRAKAAKQQELLRYVADKPRVYNYILPNDSMLTQRDDSDKIDKNSQVALEKAKVINETFKEFGFKGKITGYTIGMSVTRFNVETEYGEKVDKLSSITTELQRSLQGDQSVRVETVVEGSSYAGIEVGNKFPMAVSFKDVFMSIETNTKDNLLLPIGKDVGGDIISFPLNKMPHLLVAGTTGSGKSVLVHSMIMTLIMRNYPNQLKLLLVDPKQVEFVRYQDCPHLLCPVISKPESAVLALKKLCDEMDHRFTLLSKAKVSNTEEYAKYCDEHPEEQRIYSIVCVIDEFADLMQTAGPEVTKCVTRIAQKARAAGIYLIIATQRPSKDNVPTIIKANVPSRIGLSCSSNVDSRVILDEGGAETLLGKGDLLFKCPGKKNLIRAQSPFVSDDEINKVLEYIRTYAGDPCYHRDFIDLDIDEDDSVEELGRNNPEDALYNDIKDFMLQTKITSKTNVMRNFQLSNQKCEQIYSRLLTENFLMLGYGGYELGPAAVTAEIYR